MPPSTDTSLINPIPGDGGLNIRGRYMLLLSASQLEFAWGKAVLKGINTNTTIKGIVHFRSEVKRIFHLISSISGMGISFYEQWVTKKLLPNYKLLSFIQE
jgi:hypothetical protein